MFLSLLMLIFPLFSLFCWSYFCLYRTRQKTHVKFCQYFCEYVDLLNFLKKKCSNNLIPCAKTLLPVAQGRIPVAIANRIILHVFSSWIPIRWTFSTSPWLSYILSSLEIYPPLTWLYLDCSTVLESIGPLQSDCIFWTVLALSLN